MLYIMYPSAYTQEDLSKKLYTKINFKSLVYFWCICHCMISVQKFFSGEHDA